VRLPPLLPRAANVGLVAREQRAQPHLA
jgi:hypothetical protein